MKVQLSIATLGEGNKMIKFYCGSYSRAMDHAEGNMLILGQTTETGQEMIAIGKRIVDWCKEHETSAVFCNNDHALNGMRLALQAGTYKPEDIKVLFCPENPDADTRHIVFNEKGRADNWPRGFFDAIEDALSGLV